MFEWVRDGFWGEVKLRKSYQKLCTEYPVRFVL